MFKKTIKNNIQNYMRANMTWPISECLIQGNNPTFYIQPRCNLHYLDKNIHYLTDVQNFITPLKTMCYFII